MNKPVIVLIIVSICCVKVQAQWHFMLPMDDNAYHYSDTLLNKRAILVREGIRKVTTFKDAPEGKKKAFKDGEKLYDTAGNILSAKWCWHKISDYDSIICLKDSFVYDFSKKEVLLMMAVSPEGFSNITFRTEWISDSIIKGTTIAPVAKPPFDFSGAKQETRIDTSYWYNYYNKGGQLASTFSEMDSITYVSYYTYYSDGLLAMVSDDKTKSIFKRTEKDGDIILKYSKPPFLYQWVYNGKGQCNEYLFRYNNGEKKYDIQVTYSYNKFGLLSAVKIEHSERPAVKYYYSYSK